MKRFLVIVAALIVLLGIVYFPKARDFWTGIRPTILPPPRDITVPAVNETGLPLNLPAGFKISIFAKDLPSARVMKFDGQGNMWVSQTAAGAVAMREIRDGVVVNQSQPFRDLRRPHGLAFDPKKPNELYIAEEHQISRAFLYSDAPLQKIVDLPAGRGHFTRTLGFGPDGRLYVAIGSSCNVCVEEDTRRAQIFSVNGDGSDFREYARGLRNAVFFVWQKGHMWATEMGRDNLGDNLPPDEINIIQEGYDYGWPYCYGKNISDPFGSASCADKSGSVVDLPAHSAPLGLVFIPENSRWPKEYWNNLVVAFHGSWNRSEPTGYKIVRIRFDDQGNYLRTEDFVTGWLTNGGALGRPVDLIWDSATAAVYISDDKAGVIYQLGLTN